MLPQFGCPIPGSILCHSRGRTTIESTLTQLCLTEVGLSEGHVPNPNHSSRWPPKTAQRDDHHTTLWVHQFACTRIGSVVSSGKLLGEEDIIFPGLSPGQADGSSLCRIEDLRETGQM